MKHAGGRPTDYDPSMIQQIEEYVLTCGREQTKLPKRVDIALLLDVDDETLIEWGKKYPEFSATLSRVDKLQMSQLMDDGMYGGKEVNARIAQFLLSANHGLKEKTAVDVTSQGERLDVYRYGDTPVTVANKGDGQPDAV